MGVCGPTTDVPIAPLVDRELAVKVLANKPKLIGTDEANSYKTDTVSFHDEHTHLYRSK